MFDVREATDLEILKEMFREYSTIQGAEVLKKKHLMRQLPCIRDFYKVEMLSKGGFKDESIYCILPSKYQ